MVGFWVLYTVLESLFWAVVYGSSEADRCPTCLRRRQVSDAHR